MTTKLKLKGSWKVAGQKVKIYTHLTRNLARNPIVPAGSPLKQRAI